MASRAALVTGGSSGIGKALARVLGEEGHAVTIAGRDETKLAAAAGELAREGIEVHTAAGDVGDEQAVARIVAEHEAAHGAWTRWSTPRPTGAAGWRSRRCRPRCSTAISTSTCGRCS
jgi:NAD(P)-dependent dehydrogenase (short-subunit alcohol dehydrogenase family)